MIISTKVAYDCEELQPIFLNHPEVFGKEADYNDDFILSTFMLYHKGLGEKSKHYNYFQCLPKEPDILCNWEDEDLEWL
jgi:hypothetical protein